MAFINGHGLGQVQCAVKPPPGIGKDVQDDLRQDSGFSDSSFRTTSLIEEDNARLTSVDSLPSIEEHSATSSISHDLRETPSLSKELNKLHIQDQPQQPPQHPKKERKVITIADLRARTREQALRDFASYDFGTTEEKPVKPKPEVIDPRVCASLIAEVERPPQFEQDQDGDTVLHLTIVHGRADLASQVIDSCPTWSLLNIQNELGQAPLHLAAVTGQHTIVRKLLVHGALLDMRDRRGNTALHLACQHGLIDTVKALTRRVKPRETNDVPYEIPFQKIPQPMELLNYDGDSCLKLASLGSHFEVMQHLLRMCSSDVNEADRKSGRTILHIAAERNDIPMVKYLLTFGLLDLNKKTYEGHTALRLAQGRRHMDIVQLLMLAGAEEEDPEDAVFENCSAEDEESMHCDGDSDYDDGFDDMEFQGQTVFPK